MYIFQNALKNIMRNRGRNILMGAIIFAIILTTVVALIINNTASAVIESYKDRFSSEVTISVNMEKLMSEAQNSGSESGGRTFVRFTRPEISAELLLSFASSEYLKESLATGQISANSDEVKAIDQSEEEDDSGNPGGMLQGGAMGGMVAVSSVFRGGNFTIYGDYWQDFNDGLRSLADDGVSAMPGDNECIISAELAEENNISVGDIISFTATASVEFDSTSEEYSELEDGDTVTINGMEYTVSDNGIELRASRDIVFELKVTGIYFDLTDEYANSYISNMASMNRRNEVLTTLGTLLDARNPDETGIEVNVTYYLKTPDLLEAFEAEVRSKGLSDMFTVATDASSYESVVKPVEGLKGMSITFMLVVIILGAIILILLSSISIRERKYEIGVLRAMGMKKFNVAFGLWSEILVITCVCLVIGIGVGAVVAQPVSDILLEVQIEAENSSTANDFSNMAQGNRTMTAGGGGNRMGAMSLTGPGASTVKPLSEMKITLGFNTILEIIAIALILASISGLVSISKITKYEPIKILMDRN